MRDYEKIFKILNSKSQINNRKTKLSASEKFKRKVILRTKGEYRIIGKYKSLYEEIELEHTKCGQAFKIKPCYFLSGTRCPICNSSKGERKIMLYLNKKGVNYKREVTMPNLVSKNNVALRFDFAILDNEGRLVCLIEYDGQQHYKDVNRRGGLTFETLKEHDYMKNEYCQERGIKLIRIPYWDYKNIEKILEKVIS